MVINAEQIKTRQLLESFPAFKEELTKWKKDLPDCEDTDIKRAVKYAEELDFKNWQVEEAPWPSDIDWDNYFYDGHWILVWLKVSMLNLFILLVVLVFSTPTILWESMKKMSAVGRLIEE